MKISFTHFSGHLFHQIYYLALVNLFLIYFALYSSCLFALDTLEISPSNDFVAPDIKHDMEKSIKKDIDNNILIYAIITDEFSVKSVFLYFKDSTSEIYRKREMLPDPSQSKSIYLTTVPATAIAGTSIEYFFEAEDTAGNKKLKGMELSPLKKSLNELIIAESEIKSELPHLEIETTAVATQQKDKVSEEDKERTEKPRDSYTPIIWIPGF